MAEGYEGCWLAVDFATLQDAVELARSVDELVPFGDNDRAATCLSREGLAPERLQEPIWGREVEAFLFLEAGLYRGVYRYDPRDRLAWRWYPGPREPEPLPSYRPGETLDLAIPFASGSRPSVAHSLMEAFRPHGFGLYALDQAHLDHDRCWSLRLREALARSRYYVPVLSPAWLARPEGPAELLELARMALYLRRTQHFHAFLPIVEPSAGPAFARALVGEGGPSLPQPERIQRALANAFVLPLHWSLTQVASFLASLASGSRALAHGLPADATALRMLEELVVGARLPEESFGQPWVARVALRNPLWPGRRIDIEVGGDGRMLWQGAPTDSAPRGTMRDYHRLVERVEGAARAH